MLNGIRGYDLYKVLKEYRNNEVGPVSYERLMGGHADINAKDNMKRTALHYAACNSRYSRNNLRCSPWSWAWTQILEAHRKV